MPYRCLPSSDDDRLTALTTAQRMKAATDPAAWPISAANAAQLDALGPPFSAALSLCATAQSEDSDAVAGLGSAFNIARQAVSHFIQTLNMAIDRNVIPAAARAYYQLDISQSAVPNLASHDAVLLWGDRLAAGEDKRTKAGGQPIPFPTVGEVTAAVTAFAKQCAAESTTARVLTDDERAVAALRPGVDALILDLWDEIGFAYRKDPPATARDKARLWGVVYESRPGEPPANPPTPNTPPPPSIK